MTEKIHAGHWKFEVVHESSLGEFREIPNTGGSYRISRDGIVISNNRKGLSEGFWVVLKRHKSTNAKPFNRVRIRFEGDEKTKNCQVSRLILESWVGPPPEKTSVAAHRNGITDDDRLDNLLWAEPQDVSHGQICRGTWAHGERSGQARLTLEQVEAARKIVIEYGVSANLLATALGIPQVRVREWLTKTWDTAKWDDLENPLLKTDEK